MKIKSVRRMNYSGPVHNLETSPEHTYFANGVLVHNCYQGSTTEGEHASLEAIRKVADTLADLRVFEVALGGGEPTLHPDFVEILKIFRARDIVPNFTTRNLAWLKGDQAKTILETIGAFAFSTEDVEDVNRLGIAMQTRTGTVHRATVQVIERVPSREMLKAIIRSAAQFSLPVTLLGYKETERGAQYGENLHEYDWVEVVQELVEEKVRLRLSIDTVLAERDQVRLVEAGVPRWMFTVREGQFSMYIDAVKERIAPSSFCTESEYVPYVTGTLGQTIRDQFPRW